MKKFCAFTVLCCVLSFTGCGPSAPATNETAKTTNHSTDDHDDDAEGAVNHSVVGHTHGAGPHGGTIADWGGGTYHVEFTVDHDKQQATAYVLGSDEKTPSPIASETIELNIKEPAMQLVLSPVPQDGDSEGKSSRFVGTDEKLGVPQEYEGTLTGVIDGTPYSGDFAEVVHDEDEH